jgi:hypothetical protein
MATPPPSAGDGRDPGRAPGPPPRAEILDWVRFTCATLGRVDGLVPKLRAIGRIVAVLRSR